MKPISGKQVAKLLERDGWRLLYSGLTVVVVASLILAPVFHRLLHSFHVEDDEDEKRDEQSARRAPRNPRKS